MTLEGHMHSIYVIYIQGNWNEAESHVCCLEIQWTNQTEALYCSCVSCSVMWWWQEGTCVPTPYLHRPHSVPALLFTLTYCVLLFCPFSSLFPFLPSFFTFFLLTYLTLGCVCLAPNLVPLIISFFYYSFPLHDAQPSSLILHLVLIYIPSIHSYSLLLPHSFCPHLSESSSPSVPPCLTVSLFACLPVINHCFLPKFSPNRQPQERL